MTEVSDQRSAADWHHSRGKAAFQALPGHTFTGLLTSDCWHVYNRHLTALRQLCWAHLLRDFQKISDRPCASGRMGSQLIDATLKMFTVWADFRDGSIDQDELKRRRQPIRDDIKARLQEGAALDRRPPWEQTIGTCKELLAVEPALWTFLEHDDLQPTNNHAERLILNAVLCRNRSHGTWSERGDRFLERTLTAVVTLRLQRRDPLPWLADSLRARFGLGEAPSLLHARPGARPPHLRHDHPSAPPEGGDPERLRYFFGWPDKRPSAVVRKTLSN